MLHPFSTVHMFRTSEDCPRNLSFLTTVPPNQRNFGMVYNYSGKVDLGKGYWNPKRKLGVTVQRNN